MEFMDEYRTYGLPEPLHAGGFARSEVELLLSQRGVEVPRDTQFRRLDDEVCGRTRREADGLDSGYSHRRWNAAQYLAFEAGCQLLAAGFARSSISQAVTGTISWEDLMTEREERLRHLLTADRAIQLLQNSDLVAA